MDDSSEVIIIGGGIIGCAIACYLSDLQVGRVVVIERGRVAEASTSQAAGLLTRARSQRALVPLVQETYCAIAQLEGELGESLGLRTVGSLHVAESDDTKHALEELVTVAREFHIQVNWIDPDKARRRVPWLHLRNGVQLAFMPEDAFIDPYMFTQAFAHAAQRKGVVFRENTSVRSLLHQGDCITGVSLGSDRMFSQTVILAAGVWSGLLAWETGCGLPFAPVRSHYWITAAHALFSREQSVVILPEARAYARPEGGRLLFGLREAHSVAVDPRALPDHLTGYTSEGDPRGWKALIEGGPALERFCPALTEVQIAHYIAGLSAYTPDGLPLLGSWPGFQGAFVATGFSGMGIALAGGAGRALAELVAGQPATFDLSAFEPGRFGSVDPMSESFRQRCADARSRKVSG